MAFIFDRRINIRGKDSFEILPLATYTAGTKLIKIDFQGNSLLSTLFVKSITSGTVEVNYFDFTTSGGDTTERYDLQGHTTPTPGILPDRILVTQLHNKAVAEVILTGTAEIGVYGTIVDFSASDLDSALVKEGQIVNLLIDKGIISAYYNPTSGTYNFGRIDDDGNICVKNTPGISGNSMYWDFSGTSTPGTQQTIVTFTVGGGITRYLRRWTASCNWPGIFTLERSGSILSSGRSGPGQYTVGFDYAESPRAILATETLDVKFLAPSYAPATDVNFHLVTTDV